MTFGKVTEEKKISPVSMYFEWKSNRDEKKGSFKGWNKQLEQEIEVIPSEFILLETVSCVKGWDTKNNCGIYSNEIRNIKQEELIVKSFKGGELYRGTYDKTAIENLGCKFTKGLIVQEGDIMNEYFLQGGALFTFNEALESIDRQNYKVSLDGFEEKKNGAVVYYVPKRKQGSQITEEERNIALHSVELLEDYFRKDA